MEALSGLIYGLSVALEAQNVFYALVGTFAGTLIGVLPGLGPTATVALLLPITFYLAPVPAIIMLAAIYYGAQYGGSTTSILINLPGETSSIVTCMDGYQLARRGRAGPALAVAALGSLFAGVVATLFIAFFAPPLARFALLFGPWEYFSLMVLGLLAAIVMAQGSVIKALGMVTLGLLISAVGLDTNSGAPRMTFGIPKLIDGIDFVPLAMGIFAVGEIIHNLEQSKERSFLSEKIKNLWPTRDDFRRSWRAVLRGTAVGTILGVLPGGGATLSSFAAYALEKRLSKEPERFGQGAIEGVAAPESANNAGAQTSFIPLLTLGIPSNGVIALLAGAMMMHGIQPGPLIMVKNPDLFWGVISSMIVGNVMLVVINLPMIRIWVALLRVPYRLLYPAILMFCAIGAYAVSKSSLDVLLLFIFGLLGYVILKLRFEPVPLVLAFVLGPQMEENLRRAMVLSHGDPTMFLTRPISAGLLLLALAVLGLMIIPSFRRTRKVAF
jgi:putative tricarboxylic transport membrane protein